MTPSPLPSDSRLRSLLGQSHRDDGFRSPFASASADALAEGRAEGPERAAATVAAVLDAYAPGGRDHAVAERAADLAGALRLAGAVPSLVACLERLSEYDSVAHAALGALERMRVEATAPLLALFGRARDRGDRARFGTALVRCAVRDGRVRKALSPMLADDPHTAADLLHHHGDADALPELLAALDRLELPAPGHGELRRLEEIVAVGQAIRGLKGTLTKEQRDKFRRAYERSDEIWAEGGPETEGPLFPLA